MTKLNAPKLFYCQNRVYFAEKNNVSEMKLLFEKAVAKSNAIIEKLNSETLVKLHSLYYQATKGDLDIVGSDKPPAKAEFDAWASLKGKSIKEAQREYIVLVDQLYI